jgi:hypothetical protein
MRLISSLIALSIVAAGTPAIAASAANSANTAAAEKADKARAKSDNSPRYCIKDDTVTGSRISHQACKSKAEWAREGVDVDSLTQ